MPNREICQTGNHARKQRHHASITILGSPKNLAGRSEVTDCSEHSGPNANSPNDPASGAWSSSMGSEPPPLTWRRSGEGELFFVSKVNRHGLVDWVIKPGEESQHRLLVTLGRRRKLNQAIDLYSVMVDSRLSAVCRCAFRSRCSALRRRPAGVHPTRVRRCRRGAGSRSSSWDEFFRRRSALRNHKPPGDCTGFGDGYFVSVLLSN